MGSVTITTELQTGHFVFYALLGLLLFAVMELIRYFLPLLLKNKKVERFLSRYFPLFELLFMFSYMVWTIPPILSRNTILGVGVIVFAFIVLLLICWFAVKDIVAGMIFRSNKDIVKGKDVKSLTYRGNIERLGLRNMTIKTDEDKSIYLPYGKLVQQEFEINSPQKNIHKLQFNCIVNSEKDPQIVVQEMRKSIMLMPWVSTEEACQLKVNKIEEKKIYLQLGIFALHPDYFQAIEKHVRDEFESRG